MHLNIDKHINGEIQYNKIHHHESTQALRRRVLLVGNICFWK